jgi:serine/threonine protein kinase
MLSAGRPEEVDFFNTFRQMLLAIQACHSVGVVHRDVKPANFLVTKTGSVKLCDFGLAAVEKNSGLVGIAGSSPFMSPEMVQWKAYNCKTDVWSLGATAYLMVYGIFPYVIEETKGAISACPRNRLMQRAIATNSPPIAYTSEDGVQCSSALVRDFVQAMLERDTNKRPSSNECLLLPAMLLEDRSCIEIPSRDASPTSNMQRVKQRTAEFNTPVDPTVAKTMDDLIEQLQKKFHGSFSRSFSLPVPREKQPALSFRSSSHGGEISTRLGDETSECSTTASSGPKGPEIHWV